jgi:hypothetical protein
LGQSFYWMEGGMVLKELHDLPNAEWRINNYRVYSHTTKQANDKNK